MQVWTIPLCRSLYYSVGLFAHSFWRNGISLLSGRLTQWPRRLHYTSELLALAAAHVPCCETLFSVLANLSQTGSKAIWEPFNSVRWGNSHLGLFQNNLQQESSSTVYDFPHGYRTFFTWRRSKQATTEILVSISCFEQLKIILWFSLLFFYMPLHACSAPRMEEVNFTPQPSSMVMRLTTSRLPEYHTWTSEVRHRHKTGQFQQKKERKSRQLIFTCPHMAQKYSTHGKPRSKHKLWQIR